MYSTTIARKTEAIRSAYVSDLFFALVAVIVAVAAVQFLVRRLSAE